MQVVPKAGRGQGQICQECLGSQVGIICVSTRSWGEIERSIVFSPYDSLHGELCLYSHYWIAKNLEILKLCFSCRLWFIME